VNDVNECTTDLMIETIILRGGEKCHVLSVSLMLLFIGRVWPRVDLRPTVALILLSEFV
jgi:hypothetical protein